MKIKGLPLQINDILSLALEGYKEQGWKIDPITGRFLKPYPIETKQVIK